MPLNAGPEFFKAREKYLDAKTREEKIKALEEMIRTCPKHKSAENTLKELKTKLAKLKKLSPSKKARRITTIAKQGDAQICIIGLTQSGKSTLLSKLTNAKPKISGHPYTTTNPEVGAAHWTGVEFQLVEIPSTFVPIYMNVAQNCDALILVIDERKDVEMQKEGLHELLERFRIEKPYVEIYSRDFEDKDKIFSMLWGKLGRIRIYTKEPGKKAERRALVLKKGSTVEDAAEHLHKDFVKFFKFARVWGSSKFAGERVSLEYELKDGDVLEVHIG